MIDILNQPLAIGDTVAFPDGGGSLGSLKLGEIIRMGVKMATVRQRNGREVRRYFSDIMKVPNV